MGLPTILLLPITTHSFPAISIPDLFRSWITPAGVQDTKPGLPIQRAPTFCGWKPSTSFKGEMASSTFPHRCVWVTAAAPECRSHLFCHSVPGSAPAAFLLWSPPEVHTPENEHPHIHMLFLIPNIYGRSWIGSYLNHCQSHFTPLLF